MHYAIVETYRRLADAGLISGAYFLEVDDEELAASLVAQMECGCILINGR